MTVELWEHLPIVKDVIEFTGDNVDEIVAWAGDKAYVEFGRLVIRTPQMDMVPVPTDRIVHGVEDAFYPVPEPIFLASYKRVGES